MNAWTEISLDSFRGAGLLYRGERWRSCISRYYYAAFSAVSEALRRAGYVRSGYETPPHREITALIRRHFTSLYPKHRRALMAAIRRMYDARLVADYRSVRTSDRDVAQNARRDAIEVYRLLGVSL